MREEKSLIITKSISWVWMPLRSRGLQVMIIILDMMMIKVIIKFNSKTMSVIGMKSQISWGKALLAKH